MKLDDLLKEVNSDIADNFSNTDIIRWFNRCLDDLTPLVKKETKKNYDISSSTTVTMPTDLHELAFIMLDGYQFFDSLTQENITEKGFKVWGNEITIQENEATTFDLYYYRKLTKLALTNIEAIPEIEEEFHDLLILYATAMSQFKDEEQDDARDAWGRYYDRKKQYESFIKRKYKRHKIRVVRRWA